MTEQEIFNRLKSIIIDQTYKPYRLRTPTGLTESDVTSETNPNDLGMDSLDTIEFYMEIEKQFNISIPDEVREGGTTIGDLVKYIANRYKTGPVVLWLAVSTKQR